MSTVPVRVRQGLDWTPVDPTMERRDDGMVAPKASTIDVAFSGGGDGPLATFRRGSEVLHIDAPMALTSPVLSGASATYSEVLPGVDLVVTATGDSFGEVFVVKDAAAADNPAMERLSFGLEASGLDLNRTASGGLEVVDAVGEKLLIAEQPTMWDSSSGSAATSGGETSVAGPVEGDRQAPIAVTATEDELTLTPDAALLAAPETTFPVYIDPVSRVATRTNWGMVDKAHPTTSYYLWGSGDGSATEGMGYYADGDHTKRLFYGFNTAWLRTSGLQVASSTLRVHETWAYTCITVGLQAWLTGAIGSGTTWNNQPSWAGPSTARSVPTSGRPDCQPAGSEIDFNVTDQIAYSVANNFATTTIGLKASSETSGNGWRRFTKVATLEVVYNTRPSVPSAAQMTAPATKCGGAVPGGDMPIMQVKVSDGDGAKDQVRAQFQLYKSGTAAAIDEYYTAYGASGSTYRRQVLKLADGAYGWRARSQDGELSSKWTATCTFTVDGTAPTPPVITFDSGTFAVGQDVKFHFTGGGTGVASYKWSVNTDVPTFGPVTVASGAAATVRLTTFGPFTLRVWAYDAAGNVSVPQTYGGDELLVAGGDALDWWRMDEDSTTSVVNQKRASNPLSLSGGTSRVPGFPLFAGHALLLDGTGSGVALGAGGPANGQNFSASAWGKLTTTEGRQVLLSQDVGANASFTVAVETIAGPLNADDVPGPVLPRFTATLHTATGATALKVVSSRPLQEDEWSHAAMEVQYLESGSLQLALYTTVDGDADVTEDSIISTNSTPDYATSTAATASVRVGAEKKNSVLVNRWKGSVDEAVSAQGIFDETQRRQWRIQ